MPVDPYLRVAGGAQRDGEHGSVLGHVDLLTGEHRVDPRPQSAPLGEGEEQPQGLGLDPVLRVVEVDVADLGREARGAPGVGREEVAQVDVADLRVMGAERLPLLEIGQDAAFRRHVVLLGSDRAGVARPDMHSILPPR